MDRPTEKFESIKYTELQIRVSNEDNSNVIFLLETVLLIGPKICFDEEIWIIIPKLSLLLLFSGALNYYIEVKMEKGRNCSPKSGQLLLYSDLS